MTSGIVIVNKERVTFFHLQASFLSLFLIVASALQIKSPEQFDEWVSKLRHHRLYRQNEIAMYPNEKSSYYPHYPSPNSPGMPDSASIRKVKVNLCVHSLLWMKSVQVFNVCSLLCFCF